MRFLVIFTATLLIAFCADAAEVCTHAENSTNIDLDGEDTVGTC